MITKARSLQLGSTVTLNENVTATGRYAGLVIRRVEPHELISIVFGDEFEMGQAIWQHDFADAVKATDDDWHRYEILWSDGESTIESIAHLTVLAEPSSS